MKSPCLLAALCAAALLPAQQDLTVYQGATVWTGQGAPLSQAAVVIGQGRVQTVLEQGAALPAGAKVVDCKGAWITPGLIDAGFADGMSAQDANEQSAETTPSLRVLDGLDPKSPALARVRRTGVTTVHVMPGTRGVLGGLSAVLQTYAPTPDAMLVRDEAALRLVLGAEPSMGNRAIRGGNVDSMYYRRPTSRMGVIWAARRAFYDAKERLAESQSENQAALSLQEAKDLDVLARVLQGKLPLVTTARSEQDLRTALRLADEFGYTTILDEAQDAYRILDELKASKSWVMVAAPSADSIAGAGQSDGAEPRWSTLGALARAQVPFVITTGTNAQAQELVREATFAHRFGLSREQALAAVTSQPARLLGIDGKKGRLAAGMDADFVVWSGDPLDPSSSPTAVVIGGIDTISLP